MSSRKQGAVSQPRATAYWWVLRHCYNLTGVLGRRSGVLAGVLDFLGGVSSSLGVGIGVCATGLAWVSGTVVPGSILHCIRVHIVMKSTSWVWLIALGSDGKIVPLNTDDKEESCPAAGVFPAGVSWATGSSILAGMFTAWSWWCAGPATPAGSSSSCAGPSPAGSWWLAVTSVTMTGSADPSPADPSSAGPSPAGSSLAEPSPAGLSTACHCCWVINFCQTHHTCRLVNAIWAGRRQNHHDGSSVWQWWQCRGQLNLSGDIGQSRLLRTFTSSMILMMTRRGPAIYRCPQWWSRQGPTINRCLVMMVMSGKPWRPDLHHPWRDTARTRSIRRLSLPPGAGPTRWPGPRLLPTLDVHCRVWMNDGTLESHAVCRTREIADYAPHSVTCGAPTPWTRNLRRTSTTDTLEDTVFFGSLDLEGRPADFSTSVALDPDPVAVFALLDLDDPSLLRLVGGSWRASSGACISTESSNTSLSRDFLAAFAAAAALRLRFCSMAFSCASQASGNPSLQTSQGESSVQSVRPSFRQHCWQR